MLEQGIARLVQQDATVSAIALTGGFFAQLPKGQALPSWIYSTINDDATYTHDKKTGFGESRIQIDCYGNSAVEAVHLANAIDDVLSGYQGTLPDDDSTVVSGCFRVNRQDYFDDEARTYRRLLEYQIFSTQT